MADPSWSLIDRSGTKGWPAAPTISPGGAANLHQTKEDRVADFLREGIISGRFPRGAKLKQTEIATLIGTSITPVREAIKLLEAEGFVEGNSHRGAVVARFDIDATQEIVDLRVDLESRLALEALPKLSAEDMGELEALQNAFELAATAGDRHTVRVINFRFHEKIYSAAGLPLTLRFVRILWARYPFDLINEVPDRIKRASDEHHAMLEAMITRNKPAMLTALGHHIRFGWDEFKESMQKTRVVSAVSVGAASGRSEFPSVRDLDRSEDQ